LDPRRMLAQMRAAVDRCRLDLSGVVVLTEAAVGAYAVTPILAAMAGAKRVYGLARTTRHGTVEDIAGQTQALAALAGVIDRIEVVTRKLPDIVAEADLLTNSGHVRPIDAEMIGRMKPTAVVSLMFEAWEFRPDDLDLAACRQRGIPVAGTNERHPDVDVFSFLGVLAVKQLLDAGVAVYGSRVLLLCDNPFRTYIESGLVRAGCRVDAAERLSGMKAADPYDAIVVALHPRCEPAVSTDDAALIGQYWPGAVVAQFWGDLDRDALAAWGVPVWPVDAPAAGHMGILLSAIGPEPVVRLQTAGLKVGEVLLKPPASRTPADREFLDEL
jgi:hypothetical protein